MNDKELYWQIEALKRRVEVLEEKNKVQTYNELCFIDENLGTNSNFLKNYTFNSLSVQNLNLVFSGNISGQSRAQVVVWVNGVKEKNIYVSEGDFSFTVQCGVDKGEVNVDVQILYVLAFSLNSLQLKLSGSVDYKKVNSYLTAFNFTNKSVILHGVDNLFKLYEYAGSQLVEKYSFSAKKATLLSNGSSFLIGAINDQKELEIIELDGNYAHLSTTVIDQNLLEIAGSSANGSFVIYAVKNARVYKYAFSDLSKIIKSRLSYTASQIYASANVNDALILRDAFGNVKLVIFS